MKHSKSAKTSSKSPQTTIQKVDASLHLAYWNDVIAKYAPRILLGLIAAGFILRVLNLDALSLWVDEYVHVTRADNYVNSDGALFTQDNNGILYTFFLLPLFKFFGNGPLLARLPSVFFGVGMIYLTYRIATRLFHQYVGILSAFGVTFSLYLIFWSRIARNYAIFGFFFLLFFWLFLRAFESKKEQLSGIWKELAISPRHAALLLPAILLSLLSHQLTFFFLFSLSVYCIVQAAWYLYRNDAHKFRNKYFYLSILLIPALFLMLAPMGHSIVRMMLSPILSSDQIVWALPNWDTILKQWESERYAAFLVYNDVFRYDAGFLYFTGLAGLAGAWLWNRNSALWLCSMLVVPMLLLSFVYRDPSVQRYIIFVHPFFWIASAVFFYMVWKWASPFFSRKTQFIFLLIPFILILANAKWKEIGTLALGSQKSGFVVNPKIGGLNFTNWKDVCEYVSTHRQPDEIIMATVSNGVSYYLDDKNVLAFRQASYDTQKKQQVYNQPKLDGVKNAGSYDDLVYTVNNTPRGWLLADYYLESSYVDERARQFVYQNMHFIPEASSDGDVMLFRWDNSVPKPENQNLVVELGRTPSKVSSRITNINIPDELINANNLKLVVRSSNVDSKEEAFIVFNNQFPVFLPINKTNSIESHTLNIDKKILKRGNNTIQVGYNPKIKQDPRNGFALYYFNLTAQ